MHPARIPTRNSGMKQMRAAVHGVNRLAASRFTGIAHGKRCRRITQGSQRGLNSRLGQ
jgi:hypothetical protein